MTILPKAEPSQSARIVGDKVRSVAKHLIIVAAIVAAIGLLASVFVPTHTSPSRSGHAKSPAVATFNNSGLYSRLLPTTDTFFPIAVWDQAPNGGNIPQAYMDQAAAFRAMGVNIFVGMNSWPERFGSDDGELEAAVGQHMYVIGGGDPFSPTSAESVASIAKLVSRVPGAAKYFIGYQWGDEPTCSTNVAAQVATVESEDPSRLVFDNEGAWIAWLPKHNVLGSTECLAQSEANLRATSIASADDYALTDPWHTYLCNTSAGYDCLWVYGREAQNMRMLVGPDEPVWEFVETGTNELGLSSENEGKAEEPSATPTQVNSAAWEALLGGASGIEWFCDELLPDGTPIWDYCASNNTIRDNLSYINHTIERFAPELNAPDVLGELSVRSSDPAIPILSMLKEVNGTTYLFVEGNRNGTTTGKYKLPGFPNGTAELLYDSNARYDPAVSEQGDRIALNSDGAFEDSLPGDYSVKIYEILPYNG